ncbi:MAG: signal peptidase I [Clostridia bacterium]|nr:signal peptidase I [Clostridia bacterium]
MKKALKIISSILVWTLVIVTVGVMIFTIISVNTFDKSDRSVFGYKFFIVRSDSMSATDFKAGDIVFVKETDPATLKVGDVIAFVSQDPNNLGNTVTHKIREKTTDAEGTPAFVTYGTTTDTNDETLVTYQYVLGKYTGKIPSVGSFFQFLKTTRGYVLCIFVPFVLLVAYEAFNCVLLFRKYKKEQNDKLEKERKQSAEMQKEIEELRSQLAAKNGQGSEQ